MYAGVPSIAPRAVSSEWRMFREPLDPGESLGDATSIGGWSSSITAMPRETEVADACPAVVTNEHVTSSSAMYTPSSWRPAS